MQTIGKLCEGETIHSAFRICTEQSRVHVSVLRFCVSAHTENSKVGSILFYIVHTMASYPVSFQPRWPSANPCDLVFVCIGNHCNFFFMFFIYGWGYAHNMNVRILLELLIVGFGYL